LDPGYPGGNTNEINFTGEDSDVCFKVLVNKPTDSAYAPVFIVDDAGNGVILDLYYKPPFVQLLPDSGRYLKIPIGKDTCESFLFYNKGQIVVKNDTIITLNPVTHKNDTIINKNVTHHIGKTFTVSSDNLKHGNKTFTVSNTVPALPADIKPGDSLWITACFTPIDSVTQKDTIMLVNDCFTAPIDLLGRGAVPLIVAGNRDFGNVIVDSTKCDTVSVRNVGNADFTLTTNWILHNIVNFNFKDSALLPIVMKPGMVVYLTFCYTPHAEQGDTTVQNWGTTEQDPYKHAIKDSSILRGRGVRSGFVWDRTVQQQTVTCEDSNVVRVYLFNNATGIGSPTAHVDSVVIAGADALEFHSWQNQLGYKPLGNFDLKPGDSIWVDVTFKADLTKPMPQKYADRHMQLIAYNKNLEKDQIIDFTGSVLYAAPVETPNSLDYGQVALGITNTRTFELCDTGTAPLIIESFGPLTYPVINVKDSLGNPLQPGDTILPGQCAEIQIESALSSYIDTTVDVNFTFRTSCPAPVVQKVRIAASFVNPSNTGHPFEPTYLNCRNLVDSIQARNLGTSDLTLEKIELINQNPPSPPAAPQFSFLNGTQTLLVGKVFHRGQRANYGVKYNPTIEGPVSDSVLCTWDSLDTKGVVVKKLYSGNILTGIGKLERDTLSPLQAVPSTPYSTTTGSIVSVPINLTSPLPAGASANGLTFNVTYRRDLLNYIPNSNVLNASLKNYFANQPTAVNNGDNTETVTFTLQTNTPAPITTLTPIVTMNFELMVAKDYNSTIAVSNAVFWGTSPTDTLCYVINQFDTALFTPNPLCGDSTLRTFLKGNTPTKIIGITPNPSTDGGTPVVTYDVKENNVSLTIELFNALGERIRLVEKDQPHELGQYNLPIGVKNLPSGVYVLRITSPTNVESSQFVIQK